MKICKLFFWFIRLFEHKISVSRVPRKHIRSGTRIRDRPRLAVIERNNARFIQERALLDAPFEATKYVARLVADNRRNSWGHSGSTTVDARCRDTKASAVIVLSTGVCRIAGVIAQPAIGGLVSR